ncbi:esterase/lipase family protein [Angelakisella massiliensis]|uniref:esterase/lipase family protein n=1 Tax=Angelakisella massiliensis TaxID=1871018 RepID=UPI0009F4E6D2|nr:hypothetical protein [Angelakisella massiliensis]
MLRLGKLWGVLVVLAVTNLDVLKIQASFGWTAYGVLLGILLLAFTMVNIAPNWGRQNFSRLGIMLGGETLIEIYLFSLTCNLIIGIYLLRILFPRLSFTPSVWSILLHVLFSLLAEGILAWNGFIRIYLSSVQLGIKWRVLFLLFWWVPLLNLVLLGRICAIVRAEYDFETEKEAQNKIRRLNESCKTHYPIVLVHGVFFRDRKYFNYWGRIPGELIRNGAVIFYGGQQSAAATKDAAAELKENILRIIEESGCQKVNIIAHSKGGLESRYAITHLGLSSCVASLTTINTPHRGCAFVDWLLEKMPSCVCKWLANSYNGALKRLGDTNPDFLAAVRDLTSRNCQIFNQETPDAPDVFYQSVGSKMKNWRSAPFPQSLSYLLVRHFEKENDGLVGVESMKWGSRFQMVPAAGKRGISHGDMIDLYRENISHFDVREFYVELVRQLKEEGF